MNCLPLQAFWRGPFDPLLCIWSFDRSIRFALTKMGSRAPRVSLAYRHSGGHAPRQTNKAPIGRWSISSSLADSFNQLCFSPTAGRSMCVADTAHYLSTQPKRYAPSCSPWPPPRRSHSLAP